MKILHVSNLRFNRRWYRWLQEHAPRHDLLVIAGNLVDQGEDASIDYRRRWVIEWLRNYPLPVCAASGPEDRMFDPQANLWRSARWLREADSATLCVDAGSMNVGEFVVHCVGHGELPADRFADIYVVHSPRRGIGCKPDRHEPNTAAITVSAEARTAGVRAILSGDVIDSERWHWTEHGPMHLNPGWFSGARFPNHVVFDPATMAALRVQETSYIPRIDVVGRRSITRTLGEAGDPILVGLCG